jgi:hypothetical protein
MNPYGGYCIIKLGWFRFCVQQTKEPSGSGSVPHLHAFLGFSSQLPRLRKSSKKSLNSWGQEHVKCEVK